MKRSTIRAALSGAAAGALNGFFGAGGGMVLVPLLTRWCKIDDRRAFATAISIILPLCLVSLCVYALNGRLEIAGALPYLAGGFIGGLLGGALFRKVPTLWLHRALGLLILYGGLRSLLF